MGISLKSIPTPFLWGPPGVGKSEGVRQLAERIEKNTGKRVIVTDVRLLLFSPVDLRGVPVADKNREFTNWLRPKLFAMDESLDCVNILFLDELSAAPQSVQAAAYQICLDRKIGEHKLAQNCIVIAAGNRTTDSSVSFKMPKALCNRLMHFDIHTNYSVWQEWAKENGIDGRIIGYLAFDSSRLCSQPQSADLAYPTPRSWSFVSGLLKAMACPPEEISHLIGGCVGSDTAHEFISWCKIYEKQFSTYDILMGKCKKYPKTHDVLYALTSGLVYEIINKKDAIDPKQLENACAYAARFPADFAMAFFKDLQAVPEIKLKLMKCPSMTMWISKNRKYM